MTEFLAPSRLVDVAIVWMIVEGAVVCARHLRLGETPAALWSLANSLAGLMLLLTVRAALSGMDAVWLILGLTGALFAHLGELAGRRRILRSAEASGARDSGPNS